MGSSLLAYMPSKKTWQRRAAGSPHAASFCPRKMAAASARVDSGYPPVLLFLSSSSRRTTRPSSRIRCGVADASETKRRYWATAEAEIEAHLAACIPASPPPTVRDPVVRLVSSATRTMAPVLCVAACELVGGCRELALGTACALRLAHSAFDAHRSLLGQPRSPAGVRSPGPAGVVMGDGVKLMTGEGLLTLGYQLVAKAEAGAEPGRVLRVLVEMADAAGPQGMPEGEYEEIRYWQSRKDGAAEAEDWLELVCRKKEGRFYACAAACGAILGGAGEEETERLRRCGTYVGMLHGFLYGRGAEEFAEASREKRVALAGELKSLALSELEGFPGDKKEAIAGLLDANF